MNKWTHFFYIKICLYDVCIKRCIWVMKLIVWLISIDTSTSPINEIASHFEFFKNQREIWIFSYTLCKRKLEGKALLRQRFFSSRVSTLETKKKKNLFSSPIWVKEDVNYFYCFFSCFSIHLNCCVRSSTFSSHFSPVTINFKHF